MKYIIYILMFAAATVIVFSWGIIKEQNKTAILVTHDISEAIAMGDRVIILSKRPASVSKILDIKLSIPERTPFTSRSAPEFKELFNEIWEEMQYE